MITSRQIEIRDSTCVLDSEELVDASYRGLVGLMEVMPGLFAGQKSNEYRPSLLVSGNGGDGSVSRDYYPFSALSDGLYYPATKRSYWMGNYDVGVDPFPDVGSVIIIPDDNEVSIAYCTVRRLGGLPPGVGSTCRNAVATYAVYIVERFNSPLVLNGFTTDLFINKSYLQIGKDGNIDAGIDFRKRAQFQKDGCMRYDESAAWAWGCGCLSMLADRRFLWLVEVSEKTSWGKLKVEFGVSCEYVGSLVAARNAPMTASGRRNPILHWVQSHKRRIQDERSVDVARHLRGTEEFAMGGMGFKITQPVKIQQKHN